MSDKFVGWVAHDKNSVKGEMRWEEYPVKEFKETDIEMDILTCGICYSEISTISSGWGEARYPLVVGHEIVGKVTRVGKEVKGVKIGQRFGVGAQCDSCGKCHHCSEKRQPYCDTMVGTYNSKFIDGSGPTQGGYAKKWRGPAALTVAIPDGLESHIASPLMCGGVTIYSVSADLARCWSGLAADTSAFLLLATRRLRLRRSQRQARWNHRHWWYWCIWAGICKSSRC